MAKYLSRADIECIASEVTRQYYSMLPATEHNIVPIDTIRLAKEIMGLDVRYMQLSADGSILGMACFQDTELVLNLSDGNQLKLLLSGNDILLDESLLDVNKTGRHNFTVAHEVAHHILVRRFPQDYQELLSCRSHVLYRRTSQSQCWEEWQADTLGAAIVMPAALVRECMTRFGLGHETSMPKICCTSSEHNGFYNMARYMGVSREALAIRMQGLGLWDKNYLIGAFHPLDIWKGGEDLCNTP